MADRPWKADLRFELEAPQIAVLPCQRREAPPSFRFQLPLENTLC